MFLLFFHFHGKSLNSCKFERFLNLFDIELTILILIENSEHLLELTLGYKVDVAFIVAEQGTTDERKLGQRETVIAAKRHRECSKLKFNEDTTSFVVW